MWQQTKQLVGPGLAGALMALLLIPGSLVWTFLAVATIAVIAIRLAVPASAAVAAKRR